MFQLNQIAGAVHALTGEALAPESLVSLFLAEVPVTVLFKDGSFAMVANARVVHGSYEHAPSFERYMSLAHDLDYAQQTVHRIEQELEAYGNEPLYVYDAPVVDLSTIEVGDKVVYRSDRATKKHPVIRVAKVPRLHYPFAIETAIHFNTYTQGGSVCTRVQGKNDIVEVIKVAEPKLPIVDLGTVVVGDQVVCRQGSTHTVEYVSKRDNLTYGFWVSIALFTQTYTREGNVYKDNTSPYDIIEVIKVDKPKPSVDLSTVEVGDEVVYRGAPNSKYPVIRARKSSHRRYMYNVSTAFHSNTYTEGGRVFFQQLSEHDIIEVIKSK